MADMRFWDTALDKWTSWKGTGGAAKVSGLATNFVRLSDTTKYSTTDVFGLTILVVGSGTITLGPKDGGADVVLTAAEVTSLGAGYTLYTHCDEVTLGNVDMEVLLYTA